MAEIPQPNIESQPQTPPPTPETKTETPPKETKETSTESTPKPSEEDKSLLNQPAKEGEPPKDALKGAPETYADFKVPEGFTLDKVVAEEAGKLFKGMNLTQEQGQDLVDFYVNKTKEAAEAPFKLWSETQKKWVEEIKADPELGGKLDQVRATVARAIDGLGDPKLASEFREAMDYTGAGNNPAFIRVFSKLAALVTEGTPIKPGQPVQLKSAPKSAAQAMYPNLPSNANQG